MKRIATAGNWIDGNEDPSDRSLWLWPRGRPPSDYPRPSGILYTNDLPSMTVFEGTPKGKFRGERAGRMKPFELLRYLAISGINQRDVTDFDVEWSQTYTIKDRLPWYFTGNSKEKIRSIGVKPSAGRKTVREIETVGQLIYLFQNFTFWGKKLRPIRSEGRIDLSWRNRFVNFLTKGTWHTDEPHHPKSTPENPVSWEKLPPNQYWLGRLIGSLQTTESLMNQFIMAFPDFDWSWEFFDGCAWHNLVELLRTEAGKSSPMSDKDYNTMNYVVLKDLRKQIKLITHTTFEFEGLANKLPYSYRWMKPFLYRLSGHATRDRMYSGLTLSQVRGSSLPPFEMGRRSLKQWIATTTKPSDPVPPALIRHIKDAVLKTHRKINIGELKAEMKKSASLKLSATSALGVTREELGKFEAVARIIADDLEVPVYDLDTGETIDRIRYDGEDTGTYLFWYSVWFCRTYPEKASEIEVFAVNEQSKSRIVSKSHICVSILLFVLSTMTSTWLSKVPSSTSGMTKSNHLWNLYKRMDKKNPAAAFLWAKEEGSDEYHDVHPTMYALSADMKRATDYGCWNRGRLMMGTLAISCLGLGRWYTGLALRFLCGPRIAHVRNSEMGLDGVVTSTVETVTTRRSWLMGDPGTKVILHLVNIVSRELGFQLAEEITVGSRSSSDSI